MVMGVGSCVKQLLHFVASTADGESLVVQQIAYAPDHQHFVVLVITAIPTSLHGPQLRKFLLPIAKNMRFDTTQFTDLTNGEVAFGRNLWERILHLIQQYKLKRCKSTLSMATL